MEEALKKIYKEALTYRDSAKHGSRRKRQAYNEKLTYYLNWLDEVESEMQKAGYTLEQIASILNEVRKQHEREMQLDKSA